MATTRQVLQSLTTEIQGGPDGGSALPSPPDFVLAVGWPPEDAIMSVPKTDNAIAGVFDAGPAPLDHTRWHKIPAVPDTNVTPGISATLSGSGFLLSGNTATLTISGTPKVGDAVGVQVGNNAASYVALSGDTDSTIAAGLAAAVNAASLAATAVAVGPVVTLTATGTVLVSVATGNQGTRTNEYHRICRFVRCRLWCSSEAARESIGDPIDLVLAQLEQDYGFQVPNGEWVRLMYDPGDIYDESLQLKDIYLRDFRVRLEYGVTGTELVYPVVGTGLTFQPTPGALNPGS